jgi:hypothetical protein
LRFRLVGTALLREAIEAMMEYREAIEAMMEYNYIGCLADVYGVHFVDSL